MATNRPAIGAMVRRDWGAALAGAALTVALCATLPRVAAAAHEAAAPADCRAAATQPAIVRAQAELDSAQDTRQASIVLADAWSDAGCFNDALQVLQNAAATHPGDRELDTRLRVARSLVGEQHFFDELDRAAGEAERKHDRFRCTALADLEACRVAVRRNPDDATLLLAQGDAMLGAARPADALAPLRHAAALAPGRADVTAALQRAEAGAAAASAATVAAGPPRAPRASDTRVAREVAAARRYSNAAPETGSH